MQPEHISAEPNGLRVDWPDHTRYTYPWFWLRDHGEDADSLDPHTLQRKVDTFTLDRTQRAERAELDRTTGLIHLDWPDARTSITVRRLAQIAGLQPDSARLPGETERRLWLADNLPNNPLPALPYQAIMDSDAGVLGWLTQIVRDGFALITGIPPTREATIELAERIAPAQHTIFGDYWPLSADLTDHGDSAYTTQFLAPHTDGTYYHDAAGLQMFNCIEFDGKGGESVLVDGFAIAEAMRKETPEHYQTLTRISVPGHYLEPGVHLHAERPAFRLDRTGALEQVSFNNYDRAPFLLDATDMDAFYSAYAEFNRRAMQQDNWLKIPLRPGMALIFDNWRCLHGRMGYVGKRYFYGCYHSRAAYESRLRSLSAAHTGR